MTPDDAQPLQTTLRAWQEIAGGQLANAVAALRDWGWPAALGLLLMASALTGGMLVTPTMEARAEALRAQAQDLRRQVLRQSRQAQLPQADQTGANAFRTAFPGAATRTSRVAALLARAQSHGVAVRRSEYRFQADPLLGLARYRVIVPVEGDYAGLRGFIIDCLRADEALALDALRIRRLDSAGGGLRAELQFTLFSQLDVSAATEARR